MVPLQVPLPIYPDLDGSPLDSGYLYFGVKDLNPETDPITVYWDEDGTQPAAQPVRTLNGFASRNGTAARIYVDGPFSLTIRDKKRRLLFYFKNAADGVSLFGADLASPADGEGADLVSNAVRSFQTIANLRAYPKPNLVAGRTQIVMVQEYAGGTGVGGGSFRWQANSNQADDGGLVFSPTGNLGSGRWIRIQYEDVDPTFFGAAGDGVTDDTTAVNNAATACRANGRKLLISGTASFLVAGSLDFSGIQVIGGRNGGLIKATSAQFDVITTTGDSTLQDFGVDGGWDGSTPGLTGNSISIANAGTPAYNVHLRNLRILNSKQDSIYANFGGYSSIGSVKSNASGRHGLHLNGANSSSATTTVEVFGSSTFSDCPNGFGVKLNECVNITLLGVISEYTKGFEISGNDNRSISILSCYQENTIDDQFLTLSGSGVGLNVKGCTGIDMSLLYSANWFEVDISGNTGFTDSGMNCNGRILTIDGGEYVTSVADDFTAAALLIPPGTWHIVGAVQTQDAGSAAITRVCSRLTLVSSDTADIAATNGSFAFDADLRVGVDIQSRTRVEMIYQNTTDANQNVYLITYIGRSAGTVAYRGYMKAVRLR